MQALLRIPSSEDRVLALPLNQASLYYLEMSQTFLITVIDDFSKTHTLEEESAIDRFNDELRAADQLISMGGYVYPPTVGVIDNRNGANIETGKPLFDGPEKYSGFWLVTAADLDEARTLALKGSKACNRKVELRQLH